MGCRTKVDKTKLTAGTRVALDMTTLTIMRALPREVLAYLLGEPASPASHVAAHATAVHLAMHQA